MNSIEQQPQPFEKNPEQYSPALARFMALIDMEKTNILISVEELEKISEVLEKTRESTVVTIDPARLPTREILEALHALGLAATVKKVKNQKVSNIFIAQNQEALDRVISQQK